MCVFAWGLQYKLSLYDPPGANAHRMAAAKLLTGNERRGLPAADLRPASSLPAPAFAAAFVFSILLLRHPRIVPAFGSGVLLAVRRRAVPVPALGSAIFIRPPPCFR